MQQSQQIKVKGVIKNVIKRDGKDSLQITVDGYQYPLFAKPENFEMSLEAGKEVEGFVWTSEFKGKTYHFIKGLNAVGKKSGGNNYSKTNDLLQELVLLNKTLIDKTEDILKAISDAVSSKEELDF